MAAGLSNLMATMQEYFSLMANCIQRVFRGFLSRKHVHSFHARKRFLQQIAEKNAETRQMLQEEFRAAMEAQRASEEEKAKARFGATISKMHHLVSTASQVTPPAPERRRRAGTPRAHSPRC